MPTDMKELIEELKRKIDNLEDHVDRQGHLDNVTYDLIVNIDITIKKIESEYKI